MVNKTSAQVMVLPIDKESVERGFETKDVVVLHVNERGEGMLVDFGYTDGQYTTDGEFVPHDGYLDQFTFKGIYSVAPEQVAALQKETPGTEAFNKVMEEVRSTEDISNNRSKMSSKALEMMDELIENDRNLAYPAPEAQRKKERDIYGKILEGKEKGETEESAASTKTFDDKFVGFFDGGRG